MGHLWSHVQHRELRWLDVRDGRKYGAGDRQDISAVRSLKMVDEFGDCRGVIGFLQNREPLYIPQLFCHHPNARPIPLQTNNGRGVGGGSRSSFVQDHQQPTVVVPCMGRLNEQKFVSVSCKRRGEKHISARQCWGRCWARPIHNATVGEAAH
jgi:hypothetical protein